MVVTVWSLECLIVEINFSSGYNAGQQEPLQWQSNIIGFISLSHLDLSQEKNALMESPFIFIRFLIHLIFMLNGCYELDEPFLPG